MIRQVLFGVAALCLSGCNQPEESPLVVFIGDSITESWADEDPAFFRRPGIVERGVATQTSAQVLARFERDALAANPSVVHILVGVNDVLDPSGRYDEAVTKRNIRTMAAMADARGVEVVIGALPPAQHIPWRPKAQAGPKVRELNDWLEAFAKEGGHDFADYRPAYAKAGHTLDDVHPTKAGYETMEAIALPVLARALNDRVTPG